MAAVPWRAAASGSAFQRVFSFLSSAGAERQAPSLGLGKKTQLLFLAKAFCVMDSSAEVGLEGSGCWQDCTGLFPCHLPWLPLSC